MKKKYIPEYQERWHYTVDLSEIYKDYQEGKFPIEEMGTRVAKVLEASEVPKDLALWKIIEDLSVTYGSDTPEEDYELALKDLYQWANEHKIWVNTTVF